MELLSPETLTIIGIAAVVIFLVIGFIKRAMWFIIVAAIAVAAIIFVINLSKKDKNFMKPAEYQGTLDRKTRTKLLVTSPLIIVSVAFLFISSIFTHIVVSLQ